MPKYAPPLHRHWTEEWTVVLARAREGNGVG